MARFDATPLPRITVNLTNVAGGSVERYIYMENAGKKIDNVTIDANFNVELQPDQRPREAIQLRGKNVTLTGSMRSGMVDIRQTDRVSVDIASADPSSGFIEDSSTTNVVAKNIT